MCFIQGKFYGFTERPKKRQSILPACKYFPAVGFPCFFSKDAILFSGDFRISGIFASEKDRASSSVWYFAVSLPSLQVKILKREGKTAWREGEPRQEILWILSMGILD